MIREDLEGQKLKQSFKENILYALKKRKNVALEIIFKLSGNHQGEAFRDEETITICGNNFIYKDVQFNNQIIDENTIADIIVDNFYYDKFSYIDCIEKYGDVECQGFGEYWGKDEFIFMYVRLNCI